MQNVQVTTTRFIHKPNGAVSPPATIWSINPQTRSPNVALSRFTTNLAYPSATQSQGSLSPTSTASIDVSIPDSKPVASSTFEFHPRLYPGSVRHAARNALRSSQSPPGPSHNSPSGSPSSSSSRFPLSALDPLGPDLSRGQGTLPGLSSWRSREISKNSDMTRLPGPSSSSGWRMRETGRWRVQEHDSDLEKERDLKSEPEELTERYRERSADRAQENARFDSKSVFSEVSTPRVETPAYQFLAGNVDNGLLNSSPSDIGSFSSSAFREEGMTEFTREVCFGFIDLRFATCTDSYFILRVTRG